MDPETAPFGDAEAVLFDMDGVIVDSATHWHELEETVVLPRAVASGDADPEAIRGVNYRESYDALAERYEVSLSREAFYDLYESVAEEIYTEKSRLMPGFRDLHAALCERGAKTAVVSSSRPDWIALVLREFDLGPFDLVLSTEEIAGPGKPAPEVYERAAEELGVDPADCVVVEDTSNGIRAAVAAGMHCLGYRTDENRDTDLSMADAVVDGPAALREALGV